jgi:hypothetical protein
MTAQLIFKMVAEPVLLVAFLVGVRDTRFGRWAAFAIISVVSLVARFSGSLEIAVIGLVAIIGYSIYLLIRAKSRFAAAAMFGPLFALYALLVVCMTVSRGYDLSFARALVTRVSGLREKYPLESVAERLAYEIKTSPGRIDAESNSSILQLQPDVEQRLAASEQRLSETRYRYRSQRQRILTRLHTQTNDQFVEASGFGRQRIIDPGAERYASTLELPDAGPISVKSEEDAPYDLGQESSRAPVDGDFSQSIAPSNHRLVAIHISGLADFLDSDRIGYVQDRDHVAGFVSHRFTKPLDLDAMNAGHPVPWKIVRLELVSMLKHETPVAYLSRNLPRMDELRDAQTRPLEEFERKSLERLKSEEDVVIDDTSDRIRMVGSLRAAWNCRECHSVRRGELLGALTYELVPIRPNRNKGPIVSPPSS